MAPPLLDAASLGGVGGRVGDARTAGDGRRPELDGGEDTTSDSPCPLVDPERAELGFVGAGDAERAGLTRPPLGVAARRGLGKEAEVATGAMGDCTEGAREPERGNAGEGPLPLLGAAGDADDEEPGARGPGIGEALVIDGVVDRAALLAPPLPISLSASFEAEGSGDGRSWGGWPLVGAVVLVRLAAPSDLAGVPLLRWPTAAAVAASPPEAGWFSGGLSRLVPDEAAHE